MGGSAVTSGQPGFRDALCEQIAKVVASVEAAMERHSLSGSGTGQGSVSLRDEDYSSPRRYMHMGSAVAWRSSPNKQLERTVIRRRVRAACASFHCAHAARWTRGRAAAQLRR